jgi:hypothetical protein
MVGLEAWRMVLLVLLQGVERSAEILEGIGGAVVFIVQKTAYPILDKTSSSHHLGYVMALHPA